MKKVLSTISVLLVILILFSSCASPYAINIGHDGFRFGTLPYIAIGIRSDKNAFDIDNVTLDFSFGNESDVTGGVHFDGEDCPIVCVAVYFYNAKYMNSASGYAQLEDYKEIKGWHFVKEIIPEDFEENYKVQFNYWGRTKYDHTETLTIPKETFELTTGYVCLGVHLIAYIPSKNSYFVALGEHKGVKYENFENGKVKITAPHSSLYGDPR